MLIVLAGNRLFIIIVKPPIAAICPVWDAVCDSRADTFFCMTWLASLAEKGVARELPTRDEALAVLASGDDELMDVTAAAFRVRRHFFGRRVKLNYLVNVKSGLCPEDCFYCSQRVRSGDWDLVVTAVTTQARTGGNLAEILERIAATVRERVRIEAEAETLTAEGRLSASILVLLPPVLAVALALRSPHYFLPLTTTPLGHTLIVSAVAGQLLGTLLLRHMLKLDT